MNRAPHVAVERLPYEEPHHTQLSIAASNGSYSGRIEIYCAVDHLREIGSALARFPEAAPDEYVFEYGSDDPGKRWAYYLKMRA